jgi:3-deoxy-D-manno-octulosonate 8-phosphate phosphatase (KDO 8-P phosphatase)
MNKKINNIKLIIFDVDGVLTDGKKTYDINGKKMSKAFGDLDFTAIKILMSLGLDVIWLSGDNVVNKPLADTKNIPFYSTKLPDGKTRDKVDILPEILSTYKVSSDEIWFIGDDIFDLQLLRKVGLSSCPSNASFIIKKHVDLIHEGRSGENIASEILELIFSNRGIENIDINKIYQIQEKENNTKI